MKNQKQTVETPVAETPKTVETPKAEVVNARLASAVNLSKVITVLVPNAKGPSTKSASADRYNRYVTGMTVADAIKAGIWAADVRYDVKKNHITLS